MLGTVFPEGAITLTLRAPTNSRYSQIRFLLHHIELGMLLQKR